MNRVSFLFWTLLLMSRAKAEEPQPSSQSESLKLVSSGSCSGTVLVKSNQSWVHICKSEEPKDEGPMMKMMCVALGCGEPLSDKHLSKEPGVESKIIQCHGNETRIEDCPSTPRSSCKEVLHINCDYSYSVRLVGGSRCSGVLEAKKRIEWRPLIPSSRHFQENQLMTLCKLLGCGNSISTRTLRLRDDTSVWRQEYHCDNVDFCKSWRGSTSYSSVEMTCSETVRLENGPNKCTGDVMVQHKGDWHSLCHEDLSLQMAFLICRDLGCGFPREPRISRQSKVHNALRLNCSGDEEHFTDCPVSSPPAGGTDDDCTAARLICEKNPVVPNMSVFSRLAKKKTNEVVAYPGHSVFIFCSASLPFRARSFLLTFPAQGHAFLKRNQSAVDNRAQFVFEAAELNQRGFHYCSYDYESRPDVFSEEAMVFVDIEDELYVRLVGGESRCLGDLELEYEEEWRGVSQQLWGLKEAAVVCRQLGCGSVISTNRSSIKGGALQPVWRFFSDCSGSEVALLACGSVRGGLSTTVHVVCSDIVAPPSIAVVADKFYPENTEHVVVHRGHTFFVNCSIEHRFPGGRFSVIFSGPGKVNPGENATEYSTFFIFTAVTEGHSGNYSCFYQNTVSQNNFTFESKTVTITVKESDNMKLDDRLQQDDGIKACSGTLLMSDGTSQMKTVTAETTGWDMRHASIVCRQLSCGNALSTTKIELQTFRSTWRFFSDCDGSEVALLDCGHIEEWFSSSAIQVVCAGRN